MAAPLPLLRISLDSTTLKDYLPPPPTLASLLYILKPEVPQHIAAFLYHDSKGDQTLFSDDQTYREILREATEKKVHLEVVAAVEKEDEGRIEADGHLTIPEIESDKFLERPVIPTEQSKDDQDSVWRCHHCSESFPISLSQCPRCAGLSWPYWPRFVAQIAFEMTIPDNAEFIAERLVSGKLDCPNGQEWECKFCRVINSIKRSVCVACYRTNFLLKMREVTGDKSSESEMQNHSHANEKAEEAPVTADPKDDLQPIQAVDSDKESDVPAKKEVPGEPGCPDCQPNKPCPSCERKHFKLPSDPLASGPNSSRRYPEQSPPMSWRPPEPQYAPTEGKCRLCPRAAEAGSRFCKECLSGSSASYSQSGKFATVRKADKCHWMCSKCGFEYNNDWNVICSQCFSGEHSRPSASLHSLSPSRSLRRKSNWDCPFCKSENYMSYPICRVCRRRNEPMSPPPVLREEAVTRQSDGSWTCRWCWTKNLKVKLSCSTCLRDRGASTSLGTGKTTSSPLNRPNPRDSVFSLTGSYRATELSPRTEKWTCLRCGLALPDNSPQCFVCKPAKSASLRDLRGKLTR